MNNERPYFRYTIELDDGSTEHIIIQHTSEHRAIRKMRDMAHDGAELPDIRADDTVAKGWILIPAHRIKLISVRRLP